MFPSPESDSGRLTSELLEDLDLFSASYDSTTMALADYVLKIARRLWRFYQQSRSRNNRNGVSITLPSGQALIFTFKGWGLDIAGPGIWLTFYPQPDNGEVVEIYDSSGLGGGGAEYYSGRDLDLDPRQRTQATLELERRISPLMDSYQRGTMSADELKREISRLILESFKTQGRWASAINMDLAGTIYEFSYNNGNLIVRPWVSPLEYQRQTQGRFSDQYRRQVSGFFSDEAAPAQWQKRFPDQASASGPDVAELQRQVLAQTAKREITGPVNVNAAERIWQERGGVICCECDDPDCFRILTITREEYLHASGRGGWYRVTHPECAWGVEKATLMERHPNYYSWTKLRSD